MERVFVTAAIQQNSVSFMNDQVAKCIDMGISAAFISSGSELVDRDNYEERNT